MAELRALLLAVVLGVVWCSGSTSGSFSESVAVERPLPSSFSMTSCVEPTAIVSFYEITVKGSDSDVQVYRRITVRDESFTFASNETIDLGATDMYKCVKAVAAEGLAAFSYNGSCTGYRLQASFLRCATGGEVVLYVRTDQLVDEASVVPFDEAPRKLMDGDSEPHYMFMTLDVVHIPGGFISELTEPSLTREGLYSATENGLFLDLYFPFLDGNKCLIDNANGVPLYMDEETAKFLSGVLATSVYFLNECGKTVQVDMSGGEFLLYSHYGLGCAYYPADAPDECTVTLDITKSMRAVLYTFQIYENSICGGLDLNVTQWSTTSMETETFEECSDNGKYDLNDGNNFDKITISVPKRPLMQEIGFVVQIFTVIIA